MARLLDLSNELLLMIVAETLEVESRRSMKTRLSRLSLICKRFNDVCGRTLFHSYTLVLRRSWGKCFLTRQTLGQWNVKSIRARLEHLKSKAPFVRKLEIFDSHSECKADPQDVLPAMIILEVLDVLKTLQSLVSVTFKGFYRRHDISTFPVLLWDWLVAIKPRELRFEMEFMFPESLRRIDGVQLLAMKPYTEATNRIVQMQRLPSLYLHFPYRQHYFKFTPYDSLKSINMKGDILHAEDLPPKFFDFTQVPEADVRVEATFDVQLRLLIPMSHTPKYNIIQPPTRIHHFQGSWIEVSRRLPNLFAEDLASWDVVRNDRTVVLKRTPPGFQGSLSQDHLPDEEKQRQEQAAIDYYDELHPLPEVIEEPDC
ncbi:hypothetical protein DENSPDRAFT_427087 [Dentipellis sp. KUC8613]|nr:hypothetical protein DENSPDRAFT_427087 [Dentipellis sp. KUC8613]